MGEADRLASKAADVEKRAQAVHDRVEQHESNIASRAKDLETRKSEISKAETARAKRLEEHNQAKATQKAEIEELARKVSKAAQAKESKLEAAYMASEKKSKCVTAIRTLEATKSRVETSKTMSDIEAERAIKAVRNRKDAI